MIVIQLHIVPVVACYIHKVKLELEFGFLKFLFVASDFVLLITARAR